MTPIETNRASRESAHTAKRVLVWRTNWLPNSNTFVRDQVRAYRTWDARSFGLVREPDPLIEPDRYVFGSGWLSGVARHRLSERTQERFAALRAKSLRPHLMHAHFGTDGLRAEGVANRLGVPLVVTFHGYDVTALMDKPDYTAALRGLVQRVDLMVAVSGFIQDRLLDLGADPARTLLHHTGIPVPVVGPGDEIRRRGVLFVGRLVEKKGVADLVRVYSRLPQTVRAGHPLTIVGDGPLGSTLRQLAHELGVVVEFTGALTSSEVARRYGRCAVVCVPSKQAANGDSEGLPTVIVEAAAHRVPVIASIHAGNAEAVQDGVTGLLFEEEDLDGLQGALAGLLPDTQRRIDMGLASRVMVERGFDITRQSTLLEAAYDRLIG